MSGRHTFLQITLAFLCLIALSIHNTNGQNIEDHLHQFNHTENNETKIHSALEAGRMYLNVQNTDSAKYYSEQAIILAKTLNDRELICRGYILEGRIEHFKPNFKTADSLFQIAYSFTQKNHTKCEILLLRAEIHKRKEELDSLGIKLIAAKEILGDEPLGFLSYDYHHTMAVYYILKERFYEGIKELIHLRSITDDKFEMRHMGINNTLAWVYGKIDADQAAIPIFKQNLLLNKKNKDHNSTMSCYFGLANSYSSLGEYDEVKRICFDAIDLHKKHKISTAVGYIYSCLGNAFTHENKADTAIYYLNIGANMSRLQNEPKELSDNLVGLAEAHFSLGNIGLSESYANEAIEVKGFQTEQTLEILSNIYEYKRDFKRALEYKSLVFKMNKKKMSNAKIYAVLSEVIKENTEKKTKETAALNEQANQAKLMKFLSIFIDVLLLGFIYVMISQKISTRKLKELNDRLINKNSALQHFSYICSHDLKEPVRNISAFNSLIESKLNKENLKMIITNISVLSETL